MPGGTYFFTINTYRRQTFLTDADVRTALREAIGTLRLPRPFLIGALLPAPANESARTRALRSLPNLLAGRRLVPEILQGEVEPRRLAREVSRWLDDPVAVEELKQAFSAIRLVLRRQASHAAAAALFDLAGK